MDELAMHPVALCRWGGPHVHTPEPRSAAEGVIPQIFTMLVHLPHPVPRPLLDRWSRVTRPFEPPRRRPAAALVEIMALIALDMAMFTCSSKTRRIL